MNRLGVKHYEFDPAVDLRAFEVVSIKRSRLGVIYLFVLKGLKGRLRMNKAHLATYILDEF